MLDFDGVILESNRIKDEAFEKVFSDHPEEMEAILAYHQSATGLLRFKKFKHIYEFILKKPYDAKEEARLGKLFSDHVMAAIEVCPFVPGALEFLNYFAGRVPLAVVSINPVDDFNRTLRLRGLDHFFTYIYATEHKREAILDILNKQGVSPGEAVFIGDTLTDYQASHAAGLSFVGRDSGYFKSPQPSEIFKDMHTIKNYLIEQGV